MSTFEVARFKPPFFEISVATRTRLRAVRFVAGSGGLEPAIFSNNFIAPNKS
jgi:hypothetical protein